MRFLFFNTAGSILFERSDAESAGVTHEEMTLQAGFPYVPEKEILRGMRVGYEDALGIFQVFEIRKVRTLEPDHFQEVSAEHIAISELTDEFAAKAEWTNITASAALSPLLANTGWAIGTDTTSNTSSGDLSNGNVWNATRLIQQNWNVYIIPRIVVGTSGITNKYLDIMPAEGTWRGFRISLDKNANEIGVIWDDSKLKTALYAFGQEKNKTPLTFANVVWTATADHPAKPSGQTYLEDPTATAAYGRNGRPRFGYYQNASITDAATLLQKTWEVLQTVSIPDVTVNATVSDLHRLGYVDVPLRLHDTALIEIRPTGVILQKEIIQYTEDLLDPLQSRLTIGTYIPNIIYINRQNAKRGGGGGGSGDSQTPLEYTTENNTVQISIDNRGLQSLCVGTGAQLNPDGTLVVDPNTGYPVFIDGGENLWSNIQQNKSNISLEVTNRQNADTALSGRITVNADNITAEVTRASTAEGNLSGRISVNADNIALEVTRAQNAESAIRLTLDGISISGNVISIKGNSIDLDGYTTLIAFQAEQGRINAIYGGTAQLAGVYSSGGITAAGFITAGSYVNAGDVQISGTSLKDAIASFGTATASGGSISIPTTKINGGAGPSINFNIADTQYYQDGVAAARASVTINSASRTNQSDSALTGDSSVGTAGYKYIVITATASNGATRTIAVNATPTYDAGVIAGEGKFTLASVDVAGTGYSFTRYGYDHLYYYDDDTGSYKSAVSGSRYWYYRSSNVSGGTYYTKSTNSTTYYTKTS